MSTQPIPALTVAQYLEIEREAEFKSEYLNGEVFARAGATLNHALIASAALSTLGVQLRDKPCSAAGSDLRVFCPAVNILTYPDVTVFCEPARFLDHDEDTLTDASVIVEVLSRSTRNYDRAEKFRFYRSLPSFSEYLLLASDAIRAEHYARQTDGSWLFREHTNPQTVIDLKSIGCRLTLNALYLKARFPASQPLRP
jgi:Uma2 family endonuclease